VGDSLARYLQQQYPSASFEFPCTFRLVASADVAGEDAHAMDQTVSLFLHRITVNEQLRSVTQLSDRARRPAVFLDLHYLVTYWGANAEAEQTILTWVAQQLAACPMLDASILSTAAKWDADETVQLLQTNLSLDDVLRIWDALGPKYRLSLAYVARAVRIDRDASDLAPPVVATRFGFGPVSEEPSP
jgi:hypothetical protein